MKIKVNRESFAKALASVSMACSGKGDDPRRLVACDLIPDTKGDYIRLQATDNEVGIEAKTHPEEVKSGGALLLDPKKLGLILKELTDESLWIGLEGNQVSIKGQYSSFQLPYVDPAQFPRIKTNLEGSITLGGEAFADALAKTVYATDDESTRYQLNGVHFETSEGVVHLVATDGRRLANVDIPAQGAPDGLSANLPVKACQAFVRSFGESSEIQLAINGADVCVSDGKHTIQSRLIEGRYPAWRTVIPPTSGEVITIPAGVLYKAVSTASITATADSSGLLFAFAARMLSVSSQTADIGRSQVKVDLEDSVAAVDLQMDYRFLRDFLSKLDPSSLLELWYTTKDKPVLLLCEGAKYVVMPMSKQ